ncbi:MAG: hypothetical protein GY799_28650 [Desulfobulbaceae bacterium]|nr:hypothetical protein [Desulfobulbaceae bacterium]
MTKLDDIWKLVTNFGEIFVIFIAMNFMEWLMMTLGAALLFVALIKLADSKVDEIGNASVEYPMSKITLKRSVRIGLVLAGIVLIVGSIASYIKSDPPENEKESSSQNQQSHLGKTFGNLSDEEKKRILED